MGLEMPILLPRRLPERRWGADLAILSSKGPWNRVSEGQMGLEMPILLPGGHQEGRWGSNCRDLSPEEPWNGVRKG